MLFINQCTNFDKNKLKINFYGHDKKFVDLARETGDKILYIRLENRVKCQTYVYTLKD